MSNGRPAPLLVAAICVAVGIFIAKFVSLASTMWVLAIPVSAVSCMVVWSRGIGRTLALAFCLVTVGASNASFQAKTGQSSVVLRLNQVGPAAEVWVMMSGTVVSEPRLRSGVLRFKIELSQIRIHSKWLPIAGTILVRAADDGVKSVEEGHSVEISGNLSGPKPRRNPADFDTIKWMQTQHLNGTLNRARIIQIRAPPGMIQKTINRIRSNIRTSIYAAVPTESRDLPLALILGDRSQLRSETKDAFSRSGLMHLLAISGLHVMFVGMSVHRISFPVLIRLRMKWAAVEWMRSILTFLLLLGYALVSGSSKSVVRAVIMTSFLLASPLVRRISNPFNALGGAALVIVLYDPFSLFEAGFQLSFSAVGGLLLGARSIDLKISKGVYGDLVRKIVASISASSIATLATMPILLVNFGYVGMAGILLNIVAIPVGAGILCSSMLCCLSANLNTSLAQPFGAAIDLLTRILKWMAHLGGGSNSFVVSSVYVESISVAAILILCALFWRSSQVRRYSLLLAFLVPGFQQLYFAATRYFSPVMDVVFLDVGHGDAVIIKLPDRKSMVVDVGNRSRFWDHGEKTVLPNLEWFGVDEIEWVLISHPHADHLGGLPTLLQSMPVHCVADNGREADTHLYKESIALISSESSCHRSLAAGDTLDLGFHIRAIVLAPVNANSDDSLNDQSVVVKIIYGETSFLLTGDIERASEEKLVSNFCESLASNVIKVPHHGSRTSSSASFVECATSSIERQAAVISVGSRVKYDLPDEEVLDRWMNANVNLYSTYTNGALWFRSDGHTVHEMTWR